MPGNMDTGNRHAIIYAHVDVKEIYVACHNGLCSFNNANCLFKIYLNMHVYIQSLCSHVILVNYIDWSQLYILLEHHVLSRVLQENRMRFLPLSDQHH